MTPRMSKPRRLTRDLARHAVGMRAPPRPKSFESRARTSDRRTRPPTPPGYPNITQRGKRHSEAPHRTPRQGTGHDERKMCSRAPQDHARGSCTDTESGRVNRLDTGCGWAQVQTRPRPGEERACRAARPNGAPGARQPPAKRQSAGTVAPARCSSRLARPGQARREFQPSDAHLCRHRRKKNEKRSRARGCLAGHRGAVV